MTIAEAIRILEQSCPKRPQKLWSIKRKEAVKMAIEALNFVSEHHQSNIETYAHDMGVSLEQAERELRVEELSCSEEPNRSDLISRTRLLTDLQETVEAWSKYPVMEEEIKGVEIAIGYVKNIPSAQPDLLDDGTLLMTVPHGILSDVKRVLVDEVGTKFCKTMYQDAERKKGHWLHEEIISSNSERGVFLLPECTCSECNIMIAYEANFCPNCGADMRGEQNGND